MFFSDESSITNQYIELITYDGKYTIVNKMTGKNILPDCYDNLYIHPLNLFVLCKNGEFGAVVFPNDDSAAYLFAASMEYDYFERIGSSVALCGKDKNILIIYSQKGRQILMCTDYSLISEKYIGIEDETSFFILNLETGEKIFSEEKSKNPFFVDSPCYGLLVETEDEPLFYDYTHSEYIIPSVGRIY